MNSEQIDMEDLVILLSHIFSLYMHPKLHAFSNWGLEPAIDEGSPKSPTAKVNQRMSVISVVYNHFGFKGSPEIFAFVCGEGVGHAASNVFEQALADPPPVHSHIKFLYKCSRLVRFLLPMRRVVFELLQEHRNEFPRAINPEAFFLNTVLHSLDHSMYAKYLPPSVLVSITGSHHMQAMKATQDP